MELTELEKAIVKKMAEVVDMTVPEMMIIIRDHYGVKNIFRETRDEILKYL